MFLSPRTGNRRVAATRGVFWLQRVLMLMWKFRGQRLNISRHPISFGHLTRERVGGTSVSDLQTSKLKDQIWTNFNVYSIFSCVKGQILLRCSFRAQCHLHRSAHVSENRFMANIGPKLTFLWSQRDDLWNTYKLTISRRIFHQISSFFSDWRGWLCHGPNPEWLVISSEQTY